MPLDKRQAAYLKSILEQLIASCDVSQRREHDPVELVWRYDRPEDREVVALLTSCMAYGRVSLLKQAVAEVLGYLGAQPADFLREASVEDLRRPLRRFVYRMTRGEDIVDLLAGVSDALKAHESLEAVYRQGRSAGHMQAASAFVRRLRAGRLRKPLVRGLRYLLPDPADGGACKRLHLFFRWVARGPDAVDLGLWDAVSPADLIFPLDTHTSRFCRYLGLTARRTVDGKMAMEVTNALRQLDPTDPLRYDFALCHLGISGDCVHRRSEDHCPFCPIDAVCALPWPR